MDGLGLLRSSATQAQDRVGHEGQRDHGEDENQEQRAILLCGRHGCCDLPPLSPTNRLRCRRILRRQSRIWQWGEGRRYGAGGSEGSAARRETRSGRRTGRGQDLGARGERRAPASGGEGRAPGSGREASARVAVAVAAAAAELPGAPCVYIGIKTVGKVLEHLDVFFSRHFLPRSRAAASFVRRVLLSFFFIR